MSEARLAGTAGSRTDRDAMREAFQRRTWPRFAAFAVLIYVVYARAQLEISWPRVETGIENASRFFGRLFPPNFTRRELLAKGLVESLQIAILASTLGIVVALLVGLAGARNLMPGWVSWPARALVVIAR